MALVRQEVQLVSLASLDDGEVYFVPGFQGYVDGELLLVTAVLERTAVVDRDGIKVLIKKDVCFVDPSTLEMKPLADQAAARRSRARGAQASKKASAKAKLTVVPSEAGLAGLDDEAILEPDEELAAVI